VSNTTVGSYCRDQHGNGYGAIPWIPQEIHRNGDRCGGNTTEMEIGNEEIPWDGICFCGNPTGALLKSCW